MIVEPIGVVAAVAGLWAIVKGLSWGIPLLCVSALFGASAAIIVPALGGANVLPSYVLLLFLGPAVVLRPNTFKASISSLSYPGPGFWLLLFVAYCLISSMFLPRIFEGATLVYSVARDNEGVALLNVMRLRPGSGNITQPLYMLGNLGCFAIVAAFCRRGGAPVVAKALVVTGAVCVFFAILDLVTFATGTADLLSFMRNANYRMLDAEEILGFKRIVGSFTEAGAYGSTALALFTFIIMLWLEGFRAPGTGATAISLAVTILFCTSTATYAAAAVALTLILVYCLRKLLKRQATGRHGRLLAVVLVGVPLVSAAVMADPAVNGTVSSLVDVIFTDKLHSQSGEERMRWNDAAMQSFLDTNAMGAGVGSIRASSFFVALLSNVGVVGTGLFLAFFGSLVNRVRLRRGDEAERKLAVAAIFACTVQVTTAGLAGGGVDLGMFFAIYAGMAGACATARFCAPARGARRPLLPPPRYEQPVQRSASTSGQAYARHVTAMRGPRPWIV